MHTFSSFSGQFLLLLHLCSVLGRAKLQSLLMSTLHCSHPPSTHIALLTSHPDTGENVVVTPNGKAVNRFHEALLSRPFGQSHHGHQ